MKKKLLFILLMLTFMFTFVSSFDFAEEGETLGGKDSSFYMPNNKSVFGNFTFNGECLDGGISLTDDGTICGQKLEVYNITSVNVTKQTVTVLENFINEGNLDVIKNFTVNDTLFKVDSSTQKVKIQSSTDSTTAVQILDANGGTSVFNVDTTNERVGIGKDSPTATLDITGGSSVNSLTINRPLDINYQAIFADAPTSATSFTSTFAGIYMANSRNINNNYARINFGDGSAGATSAFASQITNHANNYGTMEFWTRGSSGFAERIHITENGFVGFGTPNPDDLLHLTSTVDGGKFLLQTKLGSIGDYTGLSFKVGTGTANTFKKAGIFFERTNGDGRGSLHLAIDSVADSGNANLGDAKLTVTSDGVLIRDDGNKLFFGDSQDVSQTMGGANFNITDEVGSIPFNLIGFSEYNFDNSLVSTGNFTVGNTALFVNANTNQVCVNCIDVIGDNVLQVDGNVNITENLTVKELNITAGNSINFLDVADFIASLSAQKISVPALGIDINVLATDADFFGNTFNSNGTGGLASINNDDSEFSSSAITAGNSLGHSSACLKFGINYTLDPELGVCGGNYGNFKTISRNDGKTNYSISFYDDVNRSIGGDFVFNYINLTDVVVFNNGNFTTPFKTWFNYYVEFNNLTKFNRDVLIDANLNVTGSVEIANNLTIGGNFTGNQFYGEMWFDMSGNSTILITTKDVWENVTGFNAGGNNGFTYFNNTLICNIAGLYNTKYNTFYDDGANVEFNYALAINNIPQNKTRSHSKLGTANDVTGSVGFGYLDLNVGDVINLQVVNVDNVADPNLHHATINLVRIGN